MMLTIAQSAFWHHMSGSIPYVGDPAFEPAPKKKMRVAVPPSRPSSRQGLEPSTPAGSRLATWGAPAPTDFVDLGRRTFSVRRRDLEFFLYHFCYRCSVFLFFLVPGVVCYLFLYVLQPSLSLFIRICRVGVWLDDFSQEDRRLTSFISSLFFRNAY